MEGFAIWTLLSSRKVWSVDCCRGRGRPLKWGFASPLLYFNQTAVLFSSLTCSHLWVEIEIEVCVCVSERERERERGRETNHQFEKNPNFGIRLLGFDLHNILTFK